MENIKIIFIDFDRTLFDHNVKRIPKSTILAIKEAQSKGTKIIVNSARSFYSLENLNLFKEIHFDGFVTQNGGCAFLENKDLYINKFKKEDAKRIIDFLNTHKISYHVITQRKSFIKIYNKDIVNDFYNIFYEHFPIESQNYNLDEIVCIQIFETNKIDSLLTNKFKELYFSRFSDVAIEVTPKQYNKKDGIIAFKNYFNLVKEEMMAIGDEINDINMFNEVMYGVCMGNGEEEAKKAAAYVTTAIDDDGIYKAFKHFNIV